MKRARLLLVLATVFIVQCMCLPTAPGPTTPPDNIPDTASPADITPSDDSVGTINLVRSQVQSGPVDNLQFLDGIQNFYNGYGVQVTSGGKGNLALKDGTNLILLNETQISGVNVTTSPNEASLFLERQGFLGHVPPGNRTTVDTPSGARITILGTTFFVVFDEQTKITTAGNFDGSVRFTPPNGVEQILESGTLVDIFADGQTTVEQMNFASDTFEQTSDEQGTPLAGLIVLRGQVPPPVPVTGPSPVAGTWVGVRENLGGTMIGKPAVASWGPNRLDVFIRGQDDALWHLAWDGNTWSNWESLGGILTSSPAAVSWGPNHIDVFALGADRALWQITWDGKAWSSWNQARDLTDSDGVFGGDPAVASWGPGRLDVFLPYMSYSSETIGTLYHLFWESSSWGGEDAVGLSTSSGSATGRDVNLLDVVTRGPENQVYYFQGSGMGDGIWSGPVDLGSNSDGTPAITSWDSNRLDLFIRDRDYQLLHRSWDGSIWNDWEYIDAPIYSDPVAVSWDTERIDVFASGEKGELLHYWYSR